MLYVLTGGARSGKSSAAESLAARLGGEVTVVVAGEAGGDPEMQRRIAAHQAARPSGWRVAELTSASSWRAHAAPGRTLVLECLGTLLARLMDEAAADAGVLDPWELPELPPSLAEDVSRRLASVCDACVEAAAGRHDAHLVVVTNETGDGVVPAHASGRLFRDELGRANRRLVDAADAAWLVVAGRCIELTGLPREPTTGQET